MNAPPKDLPTLRDWAQQNIAEAFSELPEPGDDITPRAYITSAREMAVALLPGGVMLSEAKKAAVFGGLLPDMIRRLHASAFAVTFTLYGTYHKSVYNLTPNEIQAIHREEIPAGWPPREQWRKPEEQMLVVLDAEREELWWAELVRPHQQTPILGYWAMLPDTDERGGIFQDVRAALRQQRPGPPARHGAA